MMQKPAVTMSHSIPGRLRVHLSIVPGDVGRFTEAVKGHAGIEALDYTARTGSVLVHFDPRQVTREEIVMRIALALSLDANDAPVSIQKGPESQILTNGAALAGILTGTALFVQFLGRTATLPVLLGRLAAMCTGAAVLQHGWREVREQGLFDPEVLSLSYLIAASLRGDYTRGALITWILAFGRHLAAGAGETVEIRPVQHAAGDGVPPQYAMMVAEGASREAPLFSILQSFMQYFSTAAVPSHGGLLGELRTVAQAHGEMLDGLGRMRHNIPMRFR